ncbi:hypothetical protein [Vibrio scophthalmi]|uniref:hypothetical protein n=1 Tax=Vibrio scophthalmi TaxID=45658 RepID=UPI0012EA5627|nr:hypothetical protein [Vibrio scophthalmi]
MGSDDDPRYPRYITFSQAESEDGYANIYDIDKPLIIEMFNGSTHDTKYEITWEDSASPNKLSYKTKDIVFRGVVSFELPATAKIRTVVIKGFSNGNYRDDGVYNKIFNLKLDDNHVFYIYNDNAYFALTNKGGYYNSKLYLYKPTFGEQSDKGFGLPSDHPNSCAKANYIDNVYGSRFNPMIQYSLINKCHFGVKFTLSGKNVNDKVVEVAAKSRSRVISPYWTKYENFIMYRTN